MLVYALQRARAVGCCCSEGREVRGVNCYIAGRSNFWYTLCSLLRLLLKHEWSIPSLVESCKTSSNYIALGNRTR
jgi:hypothetical protein